MVFQEFLNYINFHQVLDQLEKLNNYLNQSTFFVTAKFFVGLYLIILVVTMVLILYRIGRIYFVVLASGQGFPNIERGKFQGRWESVLGYLDSEDETRWRAAVLEAALMLDEVLKNAGYAGDNLTQRLAGMNEAQIGNLAEVREADSVKNSVVLDENFRISKEEASRLVEVFGRALIFYEVIK